MAPINENRPANDQLMSDSAGEPDAKRTAVGVRKIPEPMIFPTISVTPFLNLLRKNKFN